MALSRHRSTEAIFSADGNLGREGRVWLACRQDGLPRAARTRPNSSMSAQPKWPRNRLLLALPSSNLKQLMPELEHIRGDREQVLMDGG